MGSRNPLKNGSTDGENVSRWEELMLNETDR